MGAGGRSNARGERERLKKVDARFRLKPVPIPHYYQLNWEDVHGDSAQAAFYLCLQHAAKAYLAEGWS